MSNVGSNCLIYRYSYSLGQWVPFTDEFSSAITFLSPHTTLFPPAMASAKVMAKLQANQTAITQMAELHSKQASNITKRPNGSKKEKRPSWQRQQQQQQQLPTQLTQDDADQVCKLTLNSLIDGSY